MNGKGLSFTCDGVFAVVNGVVHSQKNDPQHWQTLCTQHWNEAQRTGYFSQVKIVGFVTAGGRPLVQGEGDPLPGQAYVTTTSLTIAGTPDRAQRHYVNASEVPYVVLSSAFALKDNALYIFLDLPPKTRLSASVQPVRTAEGQTRYRGSCAFGA